jgi:acyl carrier protein
LKKEGYLTDKERITRVIFRAIDELNEQRPKETQLQKVPKTALFGDSGPLDSLGFINLAVAVEDNFENEFGYSISVTDERARSQEKNLFQTIGTLIDYICGLVEEKNMT